MQSLQNKVVVITGASHGVGAAATRQFAAEGARIVLNARGEEGLKQVTDSLGTPDEQALAVAADVGTRAGMRTIIQQAAKKFGRIDVFVNNAGLGVRKAIGQTTEDEWDLMFNTNLKAVYYCFQELLPLMQKQGSGHIINISSMASKQGRPTLGPYGASKAALNVLCESVAGEVRNDNIKISVLMPGSIDTGFLERTAEDENPSPRDKPRMTPDHVAEKIVFLARQDHGVWTSLSEMRPLVTKS